MTGEQLTHEYFMHRCLQIAENGRQAAMPNPCVGAVIVFENRIIGEGYTSAYGGPHGEVNAIRSVAEHDLPLLSQSTLYVSLEPCSHYGKTPPCADLIISHKIPHVVIGTKDPNPLVAGNGIRKLQEDGILVTMGIMEKECQWSLRRFLISVQNKRPFITLKWAESSNRKIAQHDGSPVRITSSSTQILTHQLRAEHQGILCGWKTIFHDHPALDNRFWTGSSPQVVVLDLHQQLNQHPYFLKKNNWWRIVTGVSARSNDIVTDDTSLQNILQILYQKGIQSILVEGGSYTHQQFINSGLWDECYIYKGKINISNGIEAPLLSRAVLNTSYYLESDLVQIFSPELMHE